MNYFISQACDSNSHELKAIENTMRVKCLMVFHNKCNVLPLQRQTQTLEGCWEKVAGQGPLPIFMRSNDFSNLYIKSLLGLSN